MTVTGARTSARLRAMLAPAAVAGAALGCCVVVAFTDPTTPGGVLPPCPTRALLGVVCPGCGSLRMIYSLLHGDIGAAVHYNAVAVLVLPLLLMAFLTWTAQRWTGRPIRGWQRWRWAPMVAGIVLGGWLLVRNLPFPPFDVLRV